MRIYSLSGGIVLLVLTGVLAGELSLAQTGAEPVRIMEARTDVATPDIMTRIMNWLHSDALIDRTELPADPTEQFVVVDLRTAQDYARGHLPGAINVPPELLVAQLGAHAADPHRAILLYGYSETQSLQSLMALRLFAYHKVLHLRGGWPVAPDDFADAPATT